ncbi:Oidioi.mRNA.OKI2018_I69.PAR.g9831.t1.cds [Oikopleura dioica]|uniref:Oidioi.mRNA.OKI2018_I69.PAR.g9831.t1.cds n=1 Tax=Oikopleura dioica TaxID=34765 RepID=A0ABN7RR76_OIKDI|nr:Oidioi.mRNA.OKI2018_I69.PAR.g9831.t1.cds [Oikopleura dioica]
MFLLSILFIKIQAENCYAVATGGREAGHYSNATQIVDFARNSHVVKKGGDLPEARAGHTIVAADGSGGKVAFVLGGRSVGQTRTDIFCLGTNYEWSTCGELVDAREGHVSINYGRSIFSCGGQHNSKVLSSCEKFDLDTFASRPILTTLRKGRRSGASVVSGSKE